MDEKKPWYERGYAAWIGILLTLMLAIGGTIYSAGKTTAEHPTRPEVREKIRELAASRAEMAEVRECLKGLKDSLADFRKDVNHRLDRIESRLDKVKHGD